MLARKSIVWNGFPTTTDQRNTWHSPLRGDHHEWMMQIQITTIIRSLQHLGLIHPVQHRYRFGLSRLIRRFEIYHVYLSFSAAIGEISEISNSVPFHVKTRLQQTIALSSDYWPWCPKMESFVSSTSLWISLL